jgi:hypothetical protein
MYPNVVASMNHVSCNGWVIITAVKADTLTRGDVGHVALLEWVSVEPATKFPCSRIDIVIEHTSAVRGPFFWLLRGGIHGICGSAGGTW